MAIIVPRVRVVELHDAVKEVFAEGYGDRAQGISLRPQMVALRDVDYDQHCEEGKVGEYTLNPHTLCINWDVVEQKRIKAFPVESMIGKTVAETAKHVVKTYGRDYHILGIEYWEYLFRYLPRVPDVLKTDCPHHFLGSVIVVPGGRPHVPCAYLFNPETTEQLTVELESLWGPSDRVVLLEK